MNATPTLRTGTVAPRFVLHGPDGTGVCSDDARGRPWVLAFVRRWQHDELPAIRAELRGLGAVLLVLSDDGAWWCHPDDALTRIAAPDPRFAPEVAAISRAYGVAMTDDAVVVLDGDQVVRFVHRPEGPLGVSLATALGVAGKELVARRLGLWTLTRRDLLLSSLVTGFAIALLPGCRRRPEPVAAPPAEAAPAVEELDLVLDVNGHTHRLRAESRVSLLDALRERLALTGTKKGCDHGQCGACTVLVDGRRVLACLTLAAAAQGTAITTIEGLATGDDLHPMQEAFAACDGLQCGYCTPGQIMSAVGLLAEPGAATATASDAAIREQMSGNLCRCGAYPNIVTAIRVTAIRTAARKAG